MAGSLTTLDAVKAELKISATTDDGYLLALIEQASDAIASYCGRTFETEARSDKIYVTRGQTEIVLPRYPVTSITNVNVDGTDLPAGDFTADSGIIVRHPCWMGCLVTVDYVSGYVLPGSADRTLPADIERAALTWVRHLYFMRCDDPRVRSDDVVGVAARTYFVDVPMPIDVQCILDRYCEVNV